VFCSLDGFFVIGYWYPDRWMWLLYRSRSDCYVVIGSEVVFEGEDFFCSGAVDDFLCFFEVGVGFGEWYFVDVVFVGNVACEV